MEVIELIVPITVRNETFEKITIRRPKVRDRLVVEKKKGVTDADKEIAMIANLADVTPDVIEELDLADYAKIQEILQNFLEPAPVISD